MSNPDETTVPMVGPSASINQDERLKNLESIISQMYSRFDSFFPWNEQTQFELHVQQLLTTPKVLTN